jgi:hypothetical protein
MRRPVLKLPPPPTIGCRTDGLRLVVLIDGYLAGLLLAAVIVATVGLVAPTAIGLGAGTTRHFDLPRVSRTVFLLGLRPLTGVVGLR